MIDHRSSVHKKATIHRFSKVSNSTINRYTYIGPRSRIDNSDIGSFCSISWNCTIGLQSHKINFISTSPIFFDGLNGTGESWVKNVSHDTPIRRTTIGNDVWIGANSIIMAGVNVSDGAVIAAGSVLTKDVEPYSVVGGVPARKIKYRLPDEVINKLLDLSWWDMPDILIRQYLDIFRIQNPSVNDIALLYQKYHGDL